MKTLKGARDYLLGDNLFFCSTGTDPSSDPFIFVICMGISGKIECGNVSVLVEKTIG